MEWLNAMSLGRQHRMQDDALARQNRLGQLAGQALSAPLAERGQFASQIAEVDPDAGFAFSQNVERQQAADEEGRNAKLVNMAKLLSVAPEQARGGLYARMAPGLREMGLDAPEAWSEDLMPVVQQLAGTDQQGAQSAQRAYIEWMAQQIPEAERGEFFRVQAGLAPKAQNQQFSPQRIEQADGSVRIDLVPTRGGNVAGAAPTGTGAQPPARGSSQGMDGILAQANVLARQGVPDAQIEQFIAQSAQRQGVQMTPAGGMTPEMESAASATLDRQTFGAPAGQATNATRAAAAAEAAAAKVRAEELAKREVQQINDAPGAARNAEMMLDNIDAVLQHPDLETVTGFSGLADPRNWPGINRGFGTSDVMARIEQLQGASFLEAFEKLKGGGAITEVEGKKAEQAQARLTTAQTDEAFKTALEDLRDAIAPALERARSRIQGGEEATVVRTGTTSDGRRVREMSDGRILDESGQEVR